MGKPIYPNKILPKLTFANPIHFDTLFKDTNVVLTRRVDLEFNDVYDQDLDLIKSAVFTKQDIPGMSLNILGGKFIPAYNCFKTIEEGSEPWHNEYILLIDHLKNYILITTQYTNIYFFSKELHNIDVPFIRDKNQESLKFYENLGLSPAIVEDKYQLNGKIFLEHKPTKLNYWHAELAFVDIENNQVNRKIRPAQKKATQYIIDHILCVVGKVSLSESIPKIESKHYVMA